MNEKLYELIRHVYQSENVIINKKCISIKIKLKGYRM